jgi:hypothetical protein
MDLMNGSAHNVIIITKESEEVSQSFSKKGKRSIRHGFVSRVVFH